MGWHQPLEIAKKTMQETTVFYTDECGGLWGYYYHQFFFFFQPKAVLCITTSASPNHLKEIGFIELCYKNQQKWQEGKAHAFRYCIPPKYVPYQPVPITILAREFWEPKKRNLPWSPSFNCHFWSCKTHTITTAPETKKQFKFLSKPHKRTAVVIIVMKNLEKSFHP